MIGWRRWLTTLRTHVRIPSICGINPPVVTVIVPRGGTIEINSYQINGTSKKIIKITIKFSIIFYVIYLLLENSWKVEVTFLFAQNTFFHTLSNWWTSNLHGNRNRALEGHTIFLETLYVYIKMPTKFGRLIRSGSRERAMGSLAGRFHCGRLFNRFHVYNMTITSKKAVIFTHLAINTTRSRCGTCKWEIRRKFIILLQKYVYVQRKTMSAIVYAYALFEQ
jgi:hypothetical protein